MGNTVEMAGGDIYTNYIYCLLIKRVLNLKPLIPLFTRSMPIVQPILAVPGVVVGHH